MKTVRWLTAARDDLNGIVEYIALRSPRRAQKLAKRILDRVALLADAPESGSICPHYPARQLIFGNYIVYFTVHRKEIVVRAVVHGARLFQKAWLERNE